MGKQVVARDMQNKTIRYASSLSMSRTGKICSTVYTPVLVVFIGTAKSHVHVRLLL
jgi:hypothetical protein